MGNFINYVRSININVIPSFGRIVNVVDNEKDVRVIPFLNYSSDKSKPPELDLEPLSPDPSTLTPPDTSLSAPEKLSKNQSTNNTFTNT